jgi:hypothetical protein
MPSRCSNRSRLDALHPLRDLTSASTVQYFQQKRPFPIHGTSIQSRSVSDFQTAGCFRKREDFDHTNPLSIRHIK